jgi:hypothetical protein
VRCASAAQDGLLSGNDFSNAGLSISSSVSVATAFDRPPQPIPERRVPLRFHALLPGLGNPVVTKGFELAIYISANFAGEFPVLFGYGKVLR